MPEFLPSTPAVGDHFTLDDLHRLLARAEQLGIPPTTDLRADVSLADGFDLFGDPGSRIGRVWLELPAGSPAGPPAPGDAGA